MTTTLFFLKGGPTFILLVVATFFAGLAALRRKDTAVAVLFVGLFLQLLGTSCTNFGLASASNSQVSQTPVNGDFVKSLLSSGQYVSIAAWIVFVGGWIMFWRRGKKA